MLRVTVDRPDGADLDSLADLSRAVSHHLDDEGFEPGGAYALEVSSPGIERPLRAPQQFRRALGAQVKVKTTAPVAGLEVEHGRVLRADDEGIALEDVDGRVARPSTRRSTSAQDRGRLGRRIEEEQRMNAEMIAALRELEREKGIAFETILQGLEEAMASAYKTWWKQENPDADDDFVGLPRHDRPGDGRPHDVEADPGGGRRRAHRGGRRARPWR